MAYHIIDAHTHVYPDRIALKAAASIGDFYGVPMRLDGTVGTLLKQGRQAGVDRFLALAVAVDADHVTRVNDFLVSLVHRDFSRLDIGPNLRKVSVHIIDRGPVNPC